MFCHLLLAVLLIKTFVFQVPDTTVDLITSSGNSGGTVISSQPLQVNPVSKSTLPSVANIFNIGSGSVASLDTPDLIMTSEFSYSHLIESHWEEMSMYDGLSLIKKEHEEVIKEESDEVQSDEASFLSESQNSNMSLLSTSSEVEEESIDLQMFNDKDLEKHQQRMEEICHRLWIPKGEKIFLKRLGRLYSSRLFVLPLFNSCM